MKKFFSLVFSLILTNLALSQSPFMLGPEPKLQINNRILANVNGKPISVIDVMKKMDVIFYRQFPEYRDSVAARTQFYQASWQETLQQLIDKELIVADAEEGKLEISNGDVRQEMEGMFGPNIIENLDRIGLNFEDAWEIIKDELIIRRMLFFRVNSKAMQRITPQYIHEAYEEFAQNNPRKSEWHYYVISVQDKETESNAQATAQHIHQLITLENVPLDNLLSMLKEHALVAETTKVNVSSKYCVTEEEISQTHKEILSPLKQKTYTLPIVQKSRTDHSTLYRIFYLEEMVEGGTIPFEEVELALINQLTDQAIAEETQTYLNRLRNHFRVHNFDALTPDKFQPFAMK